MRLSAGAGQFAAFSSAASQLLFTAYRIRDHPPPIALFVWPR